MTAHEIGSKDWWIVVSTMPADEALCHLKGYKAGILEDLAGKPDQISAQKLLTRVNAEIKKRNRQIDRSSWREACRNVLDPEQFEAVCAERHRLEVGGTNA
jgi:hypothetical protein